MKERILEFLKMENRSSAQFAEEIGVQPSSISHIISGRNNPSLDFVMKMLIKYPGISSDWLLFGKGQMYRDPQIQDLFNNLVEDNGRELKESSGNRQDNDIPNKRIPTPGVPVASDEHKTGLKGKETKRIVWFFNDDTFKEFFPGEK